MRLVHSGARQLLIAIRDPQGQLVELQRDNGKGWVTIHSYRAVLAVRLNDLATNANYRVVVADSAGYRAAVTKTVWL